MEIREVKGLYLSNYYGEVELVRFEDGYYMTLDNYSGQDTIKITEELAQAIIKFLDDDNG